MGTLSMLTTASAYNIIASYGQPVDRAGICTELATKLR